jgi:hypothetical protein
MVGAGHDVDEPAVGALPGPDHGAGVTPAQRVRPRVKAQPAPCLVRPVAAQAPVPQKRRDLFTEIDRRACSLRQSLLTADDRGRDRQHPTEHQEHEETAAKRSNVLHRFPPSGARTAGAAGNPASVSETFRRPLPALLIENADPGKEQRWESAGSLG